MRYTVTGTINGRQNNLTWDAGRLSGSQEAVDLVTIEAQVLRQARVAVGPVGMYLVADLKDPLAALFVMLRVFSNPEVTGEIPEPPKTPNGAIV